MCCLLKVPSCRFIYIHRHMSPSWSAKLQIVCKAEHIRACHQTHWILQTPQQQAQETFRRLTLSNCCSEDALDNARRSQISVALRVKWSVSLLERISNKELSGSFKSGWASMRFLACIRSSIVCKQYHGYTWGNCPAELATFTQADISCLLRQMLVSAIDPSISRHLESIAIRDVGKLRDKEYCDCLCCLF